MCNELQEVEQTFLACEQTSEPLAPPAKKRGRKRKSDQAFNKKSSSAMAELAASLQISHFHKVCEHALYYYVTVK